MTSKEPQPGGSRDVLNLHPKDSVDDLVSENERIKAESTDCHKHYKI